MVQHIRSIFSWWLRNRGCILLAFSWLSGFAAGVWFYTRNLYALSSLMRRIAFAPVSIVGLLFAFLFPFLFSALAVHFHTPMWIFPISVCKAFLFAVASIGVIDSMGSAGWLFRILLLAGDVLSAPVLYLYWLRSLWNVACIHTRLFLFLGIGAFLLGCVNYRFLLQVMAELGNR